MTSIVVFGSIITLIIVSMTVLGLSSRQSAFRTAQSELAFMRTEGCLEEALIQLNRDNDYVGGIYNVDGLACTVTVDSLGDERTVNLIAEDGDFFHAFTVQTQVLPVFAILDFSY